jgi:hypothetical protein
MGGKLLDDPEQREKEEKLYGAGRGLFGNEQGEEDIEQSIGSPVKKTKGLMTDEPPTGEGPLKDIEAKINARPRASCSPGAIVPYRRDEAIFDILGQWGDRIYEAPVHVLDLCASLLLDVDDEQRFNAIRDYFESHEIRNMPTWESRESLLEYAGLLGIGGGNRIASPYPHDRPGNILPGMQRRADKGYTFYEPKPPKNFNRVRAGAENARKIGGQGVSMQGRLENARRTLASLPGKRERGAEKHGAKMQGARGPGHQRAAEPPMRLAAGKYADISNGRIELKEGTPRISGGLPWFHGTVQRTTIGGVPAIHVEEGHIICSGSLPRPKFTESYKVWDCGRPLGGFSMEIAFAQITEGMESVRPWLKKYDEGFVLGVPTEGVIVRSDQKEGLSFMTFDSASGHEALQEWMVDRYFQTSARRAVEEAITYGYVRAGASDLILDRVMRKLNRLNLLDVFEDAMFDTGSEALYVLLNPMLEETEVQEIAVGLQQEYPDVQIVGGPLDEDVDWWVLYLPKDGSEYGPNLDRILEPSIAQPLDVRMPDIVGQAIKQVVM